MSPGAASVAETDLTIVGPHLELVRDGVAVDGVGVSVEVDARGVGDRVGVSETGSVVLVLTVNETVAVAPGASVPTFHVTVPAAAPQDVPPEQLT